jgi:hypothetical protein
VVFESFATTGQPFSLLTGVAIEEKRHSRRAPCSIGLRVSTLPRVAVLEEPSVSLQGVTENVGNGGVCLVANRLLPLNSVLRCELIVSDMPMEIPTLMQVRWLQQLEGTSNYKLGLKFLL